MIIITADIIRATPIPICSVKASLKTRIPTKIAVTGSIAPSTDVMVEPIRLIACIKAKLEMIVGINASNRSEVNERIDGIGCTLEIVVVPINRIIPPKRKT